MSSLYDVGVNHNGVSQDICRYIDDTPGDFYDAAICDDRRFSVFYHLSDWRKGLLGWYEFRPGASLLEIGAEFGALTGAFCRRCGSVTALADSELQAEAMRQRCADYGNLSVSVGDLSALPQDARFDYIVITSGFAESGNGAADILPYADYVRRVRAYLKPDGVLLATVVNRYGVKYFCGEAEPHAGKPFAGISGRMRGASGRSFSRQEVLDIFREAGASCVKFYYPLPDHIAPQLIYTDEYLPEDNLNERLMVYHPENKTLVADESMLYSDIVKNGVLPFFSNSFLVECGREENLSKAVYVALSTDRGREKAMGTVLYGDGRAEKRPLFTEGAAYVASLAETSTELSAHGVPVLEQRWDGAALVMPRVQSEMLSSYLKQCAKERPEEFREIIERLWRTILSSSEEVSAEANALSDRRDLDWGPILRRASMELIPLNCFYDGKDFLFFDQEYVRDNYPAKYVLFRALRYIYLFTPEIDWYVPLKDLWKTYGFSQELWDEFLKEEEGRFLQTVRQRELYKQFYRWLAVDGEQMERNAALLGLDAEYSPEYQVTDKMKKIWDVGFGLLRTFTELCRRHGLTYYIFFGTLLGAVRHEGFIPWDDDIDVVMPRADYDKLQALAAEFPAPYFLQTPENDPGIFFGGFMRLRNSDTTGISREDFGQKANLGIWMDILPLDNCSSDRGEVERKVARIRFWQGVLHYKVYGRWPWQISVLERTRCALLAGLYSHGTLCEKLQQAIREDTPKESEYWAVSTATGRDGAIYEKKNFGAGVLLRFGDLRVNAPQHYKECLKLTAGRDYMKLPPMSQRRPHHLGIFNPDVPYTRYNDIFWGLFDGAEGKTVILFGGGFMFEDYMKKYGRAYPPAFVADNDENKWGTTRRGIPIQKPETILNVPEGERHLIICSVHYRAIEQQLRQMGVKAYKVYVQERDWILEDEEKGR